jgi:hypothetical protein
MLWIDPCWGPSSVFYRCWQLCVTVSSSLYYIIYLCPDDGLIGAET